MKTGILFDLDGTLLNTLEDLLDATNYALRQCGYSERTLGELRRFVGNGAENQIRMSLPEGASPEEVERVLSVYKPYYTAHCQVKTRPYDGVLEALEVLKAKYPIAVVSNKPDGAVKALCAEMFPGIFALGETPDCPRKPAPDMVNKACRAIGADTCVYVGDSEVDVVTAKNAGVPCLSVLWGFRDKADIEGAGGSHFCESPAQLTEKIEEIIHGE
ncbi:MAG: HAD family hydrolase [Clostridiales bacterium]|nr:HAD family hydrolase [Clostridiales bacterium]MDD5882942.1 HAD family hydrolase [Bacillota bacterium]